MVNYVYTSKPCTGRMIQTPAYAQREIDDKQTTGSLKNLQLVGVATEKQLAYDAYIMNLAAFMKATADKTKVYVKTHYFKATVEPKNLLPFPLPPLCLQSRKALKKDEDKAAFIASLKKPVEHIRYNNTDQFVMRDYTVDDFMALPFATINVNTPSPSDATSVLGMQGFLTCLKVLTLMLATHSYAAFNSPDQAVTNYEYDTGLIAPTGMYSDRNAYYRGPTSKKGGEPGYHQDLKKEDDEEAWLEAPVKSSKSYYFASMKGTVATAKPAPFYPGINFGDPKEVPSLPGYVLPYFRGVHEADPDALIGIFRRFFYFTFGNNSEENTAGWRTWCQNVRRFAYTNEGMMMTHVFFCLQTALEAQARLYVHKTGAGYLGSSIIGYKMVIVRDGETVVPETADACYVAAIRLDKHEAAVMKIVEILEDLEMEETDMKEEISLEAKRSMRRLVAEARKRKAPEGPALKELNEQFDACRFDEPFWPLTIERIEQAARAIYAGTWSIEWPMLLFSEDLYSEDPITNVLSAFGPMAPSLIDAAGIPFDIPKGLEAEDKLSVVDAESGKRPLEKIYVTGKKLNVAITDWRHMTKKRQIRQSLIERARGYRTIEFTGNGRNMLWKVLREMPFVAPASAPEKGKKRARDEDDMDDDDAPSGKRKGRVGPSSYDALDF